jgi:hypothetical protein
MYIGDFMYASCIGKHLYLSTVKVVLVLPYYANNVLPIGLDFYIRFNCTQLFRHCTGPTKIPSHFYTVFHELLCQIPVLASSTLYSEFQFTPKSSTCKFQDASQAAVSSQCLVGISQTRPTGSQSTPSYATADDLASAHSTYHRNEELYKTADQQLFDKIIQNTSHLLYKYLPPPSIASQNYSLCSRAHDRQLPQHIGHPTDSNFFTDILYTDVY